MANGEIITLLLIGILGYFVYMTVKGKSQRSSTKLGLMVDTFKYKKLEQMATEHGFELKGAYLDWVSDLKDDKSFGQEVDDELSKSLKIRLKTKKGEEKKKGK